MINLLRKRLHRKDEGFTLIELMVVVLIMGILLAIAIPAFLGAQNGAKDKSAEANLNTSLTAEKTAYTNSSNQTYDATVSDMKAIEPSIAWTTSAPSQGTNQVEVSVADPADSGNSVCLLAASSTGNIFGIVDVTQGADAGTYFNHSTSGGTALTCPTTDAGLASASPAWSTVESSGW